ncbi:hypothetical protein [Pseudomonas sp. NPDC087336]|uniref:hypothetical protein n=1 Tax=Pseudomonas sp. NPDC087336 TaxID=3364436 RepID=UPI00380CAFE2
MQSQAIQFPDALEVGSQGINANVIRKLLPIYRDKAVAPLPAFVPLQPIRKRHADKAVVIALPLGDKSSRSMAHLRPGRLRTFHPQPLTMIRIDAIWFATEPMDMRAGETALARVVAVFGAAKPHCLNCSPTAGRSNTND